MKLNFRAVDLIRIVYTFLAVKFFQAMSDIRVHGSIILGAIEKKVLSVLFCSLLRSFFNFHFLLLITSTESTRTSVLLKSADLNEITAASVQLKSPDSVLFLAYQRTNTPPWTECKH